MPRVVGMYKKSRQGLEHNLGGFFGKPKKKEEPKEHVEPPMKPMKPISDVGKEAMSAIERRKKALAEVMKD